jgi:hypothetical protein
MNKPKEFDEGKLPIWVQLRLNNLRNTISQLESYRKMYVILSDKDRDWFTLPDPFNGCNQDVMHLWFLTDDKPLPICTLYKSDMLFIGRATKERYGHRLIEPPQSIPPLLPNTKVKSLRDTNSFNMVKISKGEIGTFQKWIEGGAIIEYPCGRFTCQDSGDFEVVASASVASSKEWQNEKKTE